ncbi:MAG TPA: hypothetical protein DDY78_01780 [Planctomycetales bacterium]|jgi:hypothetical protein|nr:hypothetical protein [Planctomycetales bacterium]
MTGLNLQLDPEVLDPIIRQVVEQTIAVMEQDRAAIGDKLAYSEAEAARLLSLHVHQLRDERLRGRIKASVGPARKILYTRGDLMDYLQSRRWEKESS